MEFIRPKFRRRRFRGIAQQGQSLPVRLSFLDKGRLVHRVVVIVLLAALSALAFASGSTELVDAKIAAVTERGFILQVGTDNLTVEDSSSTKFWREKHVVKRDAFKASDLITARIKTNVDPPELRELADRQTWQWLDRIRKEPQSGTIEKIDDKYLVLRLADGSTFTYRATDKTKVDVKAKPGAKVVDLEVGEKVFAKGRTLATLDTWLAEVTDTPPAAKPEKGSKKRKAKPVMLPSSGKLDGLVLAHLAPYRMFDMIHQVATLHITYNDRTKFYLDGRPTKSSAIQPQQKVLITYTRDKYGRIVASKVELFSS